MFHTEVRQIRNPALFQWEKDMEKIFDGLAKNQSLAPSCDVFEGPEAFFLSLDVPGLAKEQIDIEVKENQLFISGERKAPELKEKEKALRGEKRYGKFSRVFTVPQNVNVDGIQANFENGVLDITLPKEEKSAPKKIVINDGISTSSALQN